MKSLADAFGIVNLTRPDEDTLDTLDVPLSAEDFCKAVVESREYRESIQRRLLMDDLPPAVECRLLDHAWGTPAKRVELTGKDGGAIEVTRVERVVVYPKDYELETTLAIDAAVEYAERTPDDEVQH